MRRGAGIGSLYHVQNVQMTGDGAISAGGLQLSLHRPTHVNRVRVSFVYERINQTNTSNNQSLSCTVSIGIYTPIHSEAVAWSPTRILNLYQTTRITLRPRGRIWGHYSADDSVVIITVKGLDTDFKIIALVEAWVSYGPPSAPGVTYSTAQARLLPQLAPHNGMIEIDNPIRRQAQSADSVNSDNNSAIGSEMSLV